MTQNFSGLLINFWIAMLPCCRCFSLSAQLTPNSFKTGLATWYSPGYGGQPCSLTLLPSSNPSLACLQLGVSCQTEQAGSEQSLSSYVHIVLKCNSHEWEVRTLCKVAQRLLDQSAASALFIHVLQSAWCPSGSHGPKAGNVAKRSSETQVTAIHNCPDA